MRATPFDSIDGKVRIFSAVELLIDSFDISFKGGNEVLFLPHFTKSFHTPHWTDTRYPPQLSGAVFRERGGWFRDRFGGQAPRVRSEHASTLPT